MYFQRHMLYTHTSLSLSPSFLCCHHCQHLAPCLKEMHVTGGWLSKARDLAWRP